jgi:hypothetical protein
MRALILVSLCFGVRFSSAMSSIAWGPALVRSVLFLAEGATTRLRRCSAHALPFHNSKILINVPQADSVFWDRQIRASSRSQCFSS